MSRTIGRPPQAIDLVPFYNGPWDGLVLRAWTPVPAKLLVRTTPPPVTNGGKAWRLDELVTEADGGTHVYRRIWGAGGERYEYVGHA